MVVIYFMLMMFFLAFYKDIKEGLGEVVIDALSAVAYPISIILRHLRKWRTTSR